MPASTTSEVDIANGALLRIGSPPITSLADNTKQARTCTLRYPKARDNILRAHDWKSAKTRAILAPVSTRPLFNFSGAFTLPPDCVRVVEIYPQYYDYTVEGRYLFCNLGVVNLIYISNNVDPSVMDTHLVDAIEAELAFQICPSLLQSDQDAVTDKLEKRRDKALTRAKNTDSREQSLQGIDASYLYDSRFAGVVYTAPFQNPMH